MDTSKIKDAFTSSFHNRLLCIDSHVGGEPARLVMAGLPPIPGQTTNDKRLYLSENLDDVRLLVNREPRGHRDMFASILVEPESKEAAFGLVYIDARRYPYLCGHATIAAVSLMIELGLIEAQIPETRVIVDTPSGPWETIAHVRENQSGDDRVFRVDSVALRPEISFAFLLDQTLNVPGLGTIHVDVSFAGGFFIMVSIDQINLALTIENAQKIARLGMDIIEAGNAQLKVQHPQRKYINTIDVVEFFDPRRHNQQRGKNIVVLGEGHLDRSPCGTGTCAKLALLYKRGELNIGQPFINEGLLGTTFDAHIIREVMLNDPDTGQNYLGIIPEVRGTAHITGMQYLIRTPEDPFPTGFMV